MVDRDDDREETERQESDKVFDEKGFVGEVWRRGSQKLFEDWLSSSSSWVSRGQVTRGTRQRVATSSWGTVLMRLRIKHYSQQVCNLKMCFSKNLLFGAGWLVRGSWLNPWRIRVQLKTWKLVIKRDLGARGEIKHLRHLQVTLRGGGCQALRSCRFPWRGKTSRPAQRSTPGGSRSEKKRLVTKLVLQTLSSSD